jgi:predicted dehydrogenase
MPVFQSIGIEVSGFTTRSKEKGKIFSRETGFKFFDTISHIALEADLDYFFVAVSMDANATVVDELLKYGKPIIVETPLAWSKSKTIQLANKAEELGVKIYVIEQFPYLPHELLRRQLFEDGIFGNIYAVHNDFSAYKYHGIARARQYLSGESKRLRSQTIKFNLTSPQISNSPTWQMADIEFSNGSRLFHVFSPEYWGSNIYHPLSFRIYGEKASMIDDTLKAVVDARSEVITAKVLRETTESGTTKRLSISIASLKDYIWENPYAKDHLSDEQTAVATLLTSILTNGANGWPPYTANDFALDIEIDQAINISDARAGASVGFPLNENKQKILKLMSYKFWKNKLNF